MGSCVNVSALSSCTADTLFYPGADVDTHMLELLQPWESHAVYMDGMLGKEDREENAKMNSVAEDFGKNHQDDHRNAYRHTSNIFRPCTDIRCAGPLTNLLYQRLVHNPAFKNVRVSKNLSVHFNMRGVSRKLQYHVNGFEEFIESTYLRKHLRGRVSTYALLGSVGIGSPAMHRKVLDIVVPKCLDRMTIVAMVSDREDISKIHPIVDERTISYAIGDTLAGRRLHGELVSAVRAYCITLRHDVENPEPAPNSLARILLLCVVFVTAAVWCAPFCGAVGLFQ